VLGCNTEDGKPLTYCNGQADTRIKCSLSYVLQISFLVGECKKTSYEKVIKQTRYLHPGSYRWSVLSWAVIENEKREWDLDRSQKNKEAR
jgi:hypothetical protein